MSGKDTAMQPQKGQATKSGSQSTKQPSEPTNKSQGSFPAKGDKKPHGTKVIITGG